MILTLQIVLIVASLLLIVLVLLHRGKGGGLSSMLGGSFYSSLSGSSVYDHRRCGLGDQHRRLVPALQECGLTPPSV
jgi:hypothetical protein